ncbi:MAG: serine/threonine protein kinase [Deltaproteobacteria bacterium]|nr:serine/threonine protein kinase [Deltaproteobacteria bacterium]
MSRDENGQLEPGTLLADRYRIERFLAGGGMGRVYLAHDQRLANRRCAIKEIFDRFNDPEERTRAIDYFHREADTLAQLKHASVPSIFDRFGEGNCHYLVMDYIEGTNLEEELATHSGVLSESHVIEIARELCDVLAYLHSFQPPIIYRDMKPGNVILTPAGRAVLIDFGIARIFSPQGKATLIGTPGFAPPEQYTGRVDERSDLYGLAATLHYLLTGRDPEKQPPFSFPPVHSLKLEASPFLAQAIDKALQYKPEDRPESVTAFKEMFLYGYGVEATVEPAFGTATRRLDPLDAHFTTSFGEPEAELTPRRRARWQSRFAALLVIGGVLWGGMQLLTHPRWFTAETWGRLGEQLPWVQIEAWLPESGKTWLRAFVADLPWEREKRLRALRDDPAELLSLKIVNSTRDGTPLPEQKAAYVETEVKYLAWEATLKNRLTGIEGYTYRLEGQFVDPEGGVAGKSEAGRFVASEEAEVSLRGVTLLEGLKERAKGEYRLELYLGGKKLGTQAVRIEAEPKKEVAALPADALKVAALLPAVAKPGPTPAEVAAIEELKRLSEERKRLALAEKARQKPLELLSLNFVNADRDGHRLQAQSSSVFARSQVRFIAWEAVFRNLLFTLESSYHRLEGTYRGPRGQILGTVEDQKEVSQSAKQATFTARLGNSTGDAFVPGMYRVDFFLDGHPLFSREFEVRDDGERASQPPPDFPTSPHPSSASSLPSQVLRGSILGLASGREVEMTLSFQDEGNGRISGNVIIQASGYGTSILEGRITGDRIEFHSTIREDTYHFEGFRDGERFTGSYRSVTSGRRGRWSVTSGGG